MDPLDHSCPIDMSTGRPLDMMPSLKFYIGVQWIQWIHWIQFRCSMDPMDVQWIHLSGSNGHNHQSYFGEWTSVWCFSPINPLCPMNPLCPLDIHWIHWKFTLNIKNVFNWCIESIEHHWTTLRMDIMSNGRPLIISIGHDGSNRSTGRDSQLLWTFYH